MFRPSIKCGDEADCGNGVGRCEMRDRDDARGTRIRFRSQDVIRLFESLWRNSFNLVYPTMDVLNQRFELTGTIDVSVKSLVVMGPKAIQ